MWIFKSGRERQLRDALADSLQAMASGIPISECLSRYPELREELEPLLRASVKISELNRLQPTPQLQQRALGRFLATAGSKNKERRPSPQLVWRWAGAGVAAIAVAILVLGVALALYDSGGSSDGPPFEVVQNLGPEAEQEPAGGASYLQTLSEIERLLTELDNKVERGQAIEPEIITELKTQTVDLVQALREPVPTPSAVRAKEVTTRQQEVLTRVIEVASPEIAPEVKETLNLTLTASALLAGPATAQPTATATATVAPSVTPVATSTSQPTAVPTVTPSPAVSPTLAPTSSPAASPMPAPTPAPSTEPTLSTSTPPLLGLSGTE